MNKQEKINNLIEFASYCQMQADELAYKFIEQQKIFMLISVCQSICDFNLSFAYRCGPEVIIHSESLEFLSKHLKQFTRKITFREMMKYDSIIYWEQPKDFNQFRKLVS